MKAIISKQTNAPILTAMLGKQICFNGKFIRSEQDSLQAMTEAQQGIVCAELTAKVNYLVLPDLTQGKTVQKKAASLNARGASIQILTTGDFRSLVTPTPEQIVSILRGGTRNADVLSKAISAAPILRFGGTAPAVASIVSENFDKIDLSHFNFSGIAFDQCSFKGCTLDHTAFADVTQCDFSNSTGESPEFTRCTQSRWHEAKLSEPSFTASLADNDFTRAEFSGANFHDDAWTQIQAAIAGKQQQTKTVGAAAVFSSASLSDATFDNLHFKSVDFDQANLLNAMFRNCTIESSSFRNAVLIDAALVESKLPGAIFSSAQLLRANFGGSDLNSAKFDGADVASVNLLGAKINGVDFSKARNYQTHAQSGGPTGPALTELDLLCGTARSIHITLRIQSADGAQTHQVGLDSRGLRWGNGLRLPPELARRGYRSQRGGSFSIALKQLAGIVPNGKVQFGTIEAGSSKSPKVGKALRDLVTSAIAEAFAQPVPAPAELEAAIKAFREESKEQSAVDKERREAVKKLAQKQKQTAKKQIAKKIEKEVGKVTDIATFLKALELRADKSKIDKATKMLKAERFQLFNDITDAHLNGVVKSQTDADLVHACRIESGGQYACCTQNLNICGGLRGSICKHLLVLIIGLVKAGQLDPGSIDTWIAKTHDAKPELNKETMGEIFIRYKGAEAGEVDWRPTETVPEDYYAV